MFELSLRVLVVSDCAVQTPSLVDTLSALHVLAEPVRWQEAERCLQAEDYDAVLIDYRADHRPCQQLLATLRESDASLPVIALVAPSDATDEREALEAGATDFLLRDQVDSVLLERALRYSLDRCESQRRMQTLQRVDALTGIANRSECLRLLERAVRWTREDNQPLAVLVLNVDGFRKFNDDFGHDTGDWLIAGLAARLQASPCAIPTAWPASGPMNLPFCCRMSAAPPIWPRSPASCWMRWPNPLRSKTGRLCCRPVWALPFIRRPARRPACCSSMPTWPCAMPRPPATAVTAFMPTASVHAWRAKPGWRRICARPWPMTVLCCITSRGWIWTAGPLPAWRR